ncbi:unnamed protein product [Owenia fusiformis]|uniref:Vesicle transport protein USE1 n=1 Tax=Owenia fusiformis TaxID=6347 RepID=A0A8J1XUJ7_OWEFU|nr:unnamed protein product [Owenia fusiformis]
MASRLEINFRRLLKRCEHMATEQRHDDWRLEKYVSALNDQLTEIRGSPTSRPDADTLGEYVRKVEFLKGLIEAEKKSSSSEKSQATQFLAPGTLSASETLTTSKEAHIQTKSRYQGEMRDELLGNTPEPQENGVRQRVKLEENEDIDQVVAHHNKIQERVAEEMLLLAGRLKQNATSAHHIIKDDTKRLGDSTKLADKNYSKLKVESERLEVHTKKGCNWWMWAMILIVCMTFTWMILFMRMFPKR